MKKIYRIDDIGNRFSESKKKLLSDKNELLKCELVEQEMLYDVESLDEKLKVEVCQLMDEVAEKKNVLIKNIGTTTNEMRAMKENIVNMAEDSKKQEVLLRKQEMIRKFGEVVQGTKELNDDILKLSILEKNINKELVESENILNGNLDDRIFVSISDKDDMSWEVEEILNDREKRYDAFEEVCTGTQDIFESNITLKRNLLDHAQATSDGLSTAVNVVTISSALVVETIMRKLKGEK